MIQWLCEQRRVRMTMKRATPNKVFWLDDLQWSVLESHLPTKQTGPKRKDDRRIISGIIHMLQSGCRWRDCPSEYGPPRQCTIGIIAGRIVGYGKGSSVTWHPSSAHITRTASTPRSSMHTARRAVKRGRIRGDRKEPGRAHHENPCRDG